MSCDAAKCQWYWDNAMCGIFLDQSCRSLIPRRALDQCQCATAPVFPPAIFMQTILIPVSVFTVAKYEIVKLWNREQKDVVESMTPPTPPKTHNCDVLFEGWHWCIYLNKYMKDRPSDLPNRRGVAKIKVSDLCSNYWEPIPLLHILPYFIENICIDKHIFSLTSLLPVTTNTISNKSSWGNFQLWAQNIKQGKSKAKLQRVKKILGQEWHWSSWWSLWSSRIPVSLLIGSLLWLS